MSFIANLLTLLNWNVRRQRRTHSYGGNVSASASEMSGIEYAAERAAGHELSDPLPEVEVYYRVFDEGAIFTDETGAWIIAETDESYVEWGAGTDDNDDDRGSGGSAVEVYRGP